MATSIHKHKLMIFNFRFTVACCPEKNTEPTDHISFEPFAKSTEYVQNERPV